MFVKSVGVVLLSLTAWHVENGVAYAADSADEYENVHAVAVGSAIGDFYRLFNKGFTVFDNSVEVVPIADWGIDTWVTDELTKALAPRFTVKQITLDIPSLTGCNENWSHCAALPHRADVDAYVIAVKRTINDVSGLADLRGLGQMHSGGPFGMHYDEMHAAYMIVVIDAKDGHLIDYGDAWLSGFTAFGADQPVVGGLPASVWPESAAQMTDDQKAFAKSTMMKLIAASLPRALQNARLVAPSPDAPTK